MNKGEIYLHVDFLAQEDTYELNKSNEEVPKDDHVTERGRVQVPDEEHEILVAAKTQNHQDNKYHTLKIKR